MKLLGLGRAECPEFPELTLKINGVTNDFTNEKWDSKILRLPKTDQGGAGGENLFQYEVPPKFPYSILKTLHGVVFV